MRVNVCVPSTHTKDSGLWSRDTVWPSFRLQQWVKELWLDVVTGNTASHLRVVVKWDDTQTGQLEDTVVW